MFTGVRQTDASARDIKLLSEQMDLLIKQVHLLRKQVEAYI